MILWAGWHRLDADVPVRATNHRTLPPVEDVRPVSAEHSLVLTEGLHAPSHARAWVSARTPDVPRTTAEDALLIVSELVTNAVRHGRPEVVLQVEVRSDCVRIEVRDGSAELPVVPNDQPAVDRPTGRGLLIVAATASDWGIARTADSSGKTVWAELRFDSHDGR
jgi:anti-sigma regulatory factor (Ser/Thr protein kinase)